MSNRTSYEGTAAFLFVLLVFMNAAWMITYVHEANIVSQRDSEIQVLQENLYIAKHGLECFSDWPLTVTMNLAFHSMGSFGLPYIGRNGVKITVDLLNQSADESKIGWALSESYPVFNESTAHIMGHGNTQGGYWPTDQNALYQVSLVNLNDYAVTVLVTVYASPPYCIP